MNSKNISVALLISTYNWPEALELVLLSALEQTVYPDEIIIADDGSGPETRELIDRYRDRFKAPIKYAWHEDKGFRKSIVINKAVKLCSSDYIIQVDGDIILHPKLIEDHLKAAEGGFFVQGSRTMLKKERSQEILHTKQIRFTPFSKGLYSRFNSFRIPVLSAFFRSDPRDPFNVRACNLAFWKEDYIKINGYYNNFEGWGWEDYEFAARLINSGVLKKRLKMAAIGYHIFHRQSSRENFKLNEEIYNNTLKNNLTYTSDGYCQV